MIAGTRDSVSLLISVSAIADSRAPSVNNPFVMWPVLLEGPVFHPFAVSVPRDTLGSPAKQPSATLHAHLFSDARLQTCAHALLGSQGHSVQLYQALIPSLVQGSVPVYIQAVIPSLGRFFWRLSLSGHLTSSRPTRISRFWWGFPSNLEHVDAVYERQSDHKIIFFRGDGLEALGAQYWLFQDNVLQEGYPRPISDFGLSVSGIDAVFSGIFDGKTYFFRNGLMWIYDEREEKLDPNSPSEFWPWAEIPRKIDSALSWKDANLLGIVILSCRQCGLSNCTTRYLVAMATADLLVILTEVLLRRISYYYFHMTFLDITPVCSVRAVLLSAATDCSVWFTVSFSFDRYVSICCQKLKTMYCTERTTIVVLATTCTLLCLRNIPFYFIFEPWVIIDNVLWFCVVKPNVYNDPAWVGFSWLDAVLTPLLPFALILLLNALTVRHILVASQARKRLRGESKGENPRDPEMENRRKSVILLFAISGSFILLWLVSVIEFLYYHITGADPRHYTQSEVIFRQIGVMLVNLSCCTNTFIYGVTQSKFREQVKSLMEYPVTAIVQFMNKRP
ncbi:uncharacterized protein LOC109924719 [Rhincodon typus]|uniref:uncharacterized protein LOC109924719 n=1 Tax=Rhincodon typus TaxID=259920 RepID=UPI00202F22F4|nr:uncharacterized protein LOC109924719 [Rhincodon typus]